MKVADFGIAKSEADSDLDPRRHHGRHGRLPLPRAGRGRGRGRSSRRVLARPSCSTSAHRVDCRSPATPRRPARWQRLHQVPARPDRARRRHPAGARRRASCASLARHPERRFSTMTEFGAALGRSLDPVARAGADRSRADRALRARPPPPGTVARGPDTGELPPTRRRRDRRWFGTFVLVLLIGGALLLIAALVDDKSADRPSETATPLEPGDLVLVPITDVTPFDPEGSGTPGENDAPKDRAHDGSRRDRMAVGALPATRLRGEVGRRPARPARPHRDRSSGWRSTAPPPTGPPRCTSSTARRPRRPHRPARATAPWPADPTVAPTSTSVEGEGIVVLIWFTDLGDGPVKYRMDVGEVRVVGRI